MLATNVIHPASKVVYNSGLACAPTSVTLPTLQDEKEPLVRSKVRHRLKVRHRGTVQYATGVPFLTTLSIVSCLKSHQPCAVLSSPEGNQPDVARPAQGLIFLLDLCEPRPGFSPAYPLCQLSPVGQLSQGACAGRVWGNLEWCLVPGRLSRHTYEAGGHHSPRL